MANRRRSRGVAGHGLTFDMAAVLEQSGLSTSTRRHGKRGTTIQVSNFLATHSKVSNGGVSFSGTLTRPRWTREECVKRNQPSDKRVIKADYDFNEPTLKFNTKLPWADVPDYLRHLVLFQPKEITEKFPVLCQELTLENYEWKFKLLLWIEEIEREIEFRQYDQEGTILKRTSSDYFALPVDGLAEGRPSLMVTDKVHLERDDEDVIYEGIIKVIQSEQVLVSFARQFSDQYRGKSYDVKFFESRGAIRSYHWALGEVQELPSSVLFPTDGIKSKDPWLDVTVDTIRFNSNLNSRQKNAVVNVLRSECRPSPYVLFGPPGTGKTVTLVECILQVFQKISRSKILVCGVSNTCADTMALKLIESGLITREMMVRIYARSRADKIPENLKRFSTVFGDDVDFTKWLNHRIIVSTCASVGKIALATKDEGVIFTHTFIDEAAQAMEPECLLAIYLSAQNGGCTMIAGDPYQLGPVIKANNVIGRNDLSWTLMERLCAMEPYRKHGKDYEESGFYDPRVLTKLIESHRCCRELIKVNSALFYDDELICHPRIDTELMQKMNLKFPIQFLAISGLDERAKNSPSWFNTAEAKLCVKKLRQLYDAGLSDDDIGIITPYRGQCTEIRRVITDVWPKRVKPACKIATIEEFQGGERRVIILSMVRSRVVNLGHDKKFGLGFIFNDKRFNVATSRAKSLLIVIGNPAVLEGDETWQCFITYCDYMDTMFQVPLSDFK